MIDFMTWFETWPQSLRLAFVLGPFVTGFSGLAIGAYTTYRNLDEIQAHFPNSPCIHNLTRLWAGIDFSSRCLQTAAISGVVLWPKGFIRRGELDPEELRNFPPHLRRRLVVITWLVFVGLAWMFLAVVLRKFSNG